MLSLTVSEILSISGFDGHFRLSVTIGIALRYSFKLAVDETLCYRWNFYDRPVILSEMYRYKYYLFG